MSQTLTRRLCVVPDTRWLAAIILVGFALRIAQLGDQSLWNDEAFSWLISTLPLGVDVGGALFSLERRIWMVLQYAVGMIILLIRA